MPGSNEDQVISQTQTHAHLICMKKTHTRHTYERTRVQGGRVIISIGIEV